MKRSVIVLLASLATAGPLLAQDGARPHTRAGFWWGFGGGWGSAGANCDDCSDERVSGFAGYFRLGGTLSPNVLLGVESNGWFHSEDGADQSLGYGSVVALLYPSRDGGFYFKVGLGGMSYFEETALGDVTALAPAVLLGAGYEFRVGANVSIVPFLNSLASSGAEFELNDVSVDTDISLTLFQLGVGITWH